MCPNVEGRAKLKPYGWSRFASSGTRSEAVALTTVSVVPIIAMSELTLQLTRKQQELLLRGLRYVRSSIALDPLDWTEQVELDRRSKYAEISELETMLNGAKIVEAVAHA